MATDFNKLADKLLGTQQQTTKLEVKAGGIPPGVYRVTFAGVEPSRNMRYGPGLVWKFQVIEGDLAGQVTMRITPASPTPQNACGKMIAGITGSPAQPGEIVDVEPFIGTQYAALVVDPDGTGSRVEAVLCAD